MEREEEELWSLHSMDEISSLTSAENIEAETTQENTDDEQKAQDNDLNAYLKKCERLYEMRKAEEDLCQEIERTQAYFHRNAKLDYAQIAIEELRAKINSLEKKVEAESFAKAELLEKYECAQRTIEDFETTIRCMVEQNESVLDKNAELLKLYQDSELINKELREKTHTAKNQNKCERRKNAKLLKQYEDAQLKIKELREKNRIAEEQNESECNKNAKLLQQCQVSESIIKDLREKNRTAKNQNKSERRKNAKLLKQYEDAQLKIKELREKNRIAEIQNEANNRQNVEVTNKELQQETLQKAEVNIPTLQFEPEKPTSFTKRDLSYHVRIENQTKSGIYWKICSDFPIAFKPNNGIIVRPGSTKLIMVKWVHGKLPINKCTLSATLKWATLLDGDKFVEDIDNSWFTNRRGGEKIISFKIDPQQGSIC